MNGVREPAGRDFLQGFHRWHIEWIDVVSVEGIVLPTDPVLLSLQTIAGLGEEVSNHGETSSRCASSRGPGRYRSIAWRSSMPGR